MDSTEKLGKDNAIELGSRSGTSESNSDGLPSERSSLRENKVRDIQQKKNTPYADQSM